MNRRLGRILAYFLLLSAGFAEGSPAWKWSLLNGFDGAEILSMASGEGIIMAATRTRGVYRSDDTGRTWQPHGNTAIRLHFLEYDSASHRFYGLGDSSLYAAEPQAREWTKLTDYSPDDFGFVDNSQPGGQTTARFSVHGRVLILLNSQSSGVQVSRDGGRTWVPRNGNLQEIVEPGNSKVWGSKSKGNSLYAVERESVGNLLQATLHRSTDGGSSSSTIGKFESKYPIIWSSTSWMEVADMGMQLFLSSPVGVLRSADGGATWDAPLRNESNSTWTILSGGIGLYAVLSKQGGVRVSTDSGETWKTILLPAPGWSGRMPIS